MFVLGMVHILVFRTQLERWGKAGTRPRTQAGDVGRLPAFWLCPADHSGTGSPGWRLGRQGLRYQGASVMFQAGQQLEANRVHPLCPVRTAFVQDWKLQQGGTVSSFGSCVLGTGCLVGACESAVHAAFTSPLPKPAGSCSLSGAQAGL